MKNPPFNENDRYDALVRGMRVTRAMTVFLLFLGGAGAVFLGFLLAPFLGPLF
jgi:hypothetical protein